MKPFEILPNSSNKVEIYKKFIRFEYENESLINSLLSNNDLESDVRIISLLLLCRDQSDFYNTFGPHSLVPQIRNVYMPRDLIYAPIDFGNNWTLIFNYNDKHDGYYLALRLLDLMIIDLDACELQSIITKIECEYNDMLWAIHQTSDDHYHLLLLSNPVFYGSDTAIKFGLEFKNDVHFGQISLYRGYSVRVISKDENEFKYPLIKMIGGGKADEELQITYNLLLDNINKWGKYNIKSFNNSGAFREELYNEWYKCIITKGEGDLGLITYFECCPAYLVRDNEDILFKKVSYEYKIKNSELLNLLKYKNCDSTRSEEVWDWATRRQSCYQILESNVKYAVGLDMSVVLYFISFRSLLMIDYDYKNRLQILGHFCRNHPEYTFRIASSPKGYHCFCTSHIIEFDSEEAKTLMSRLRSDPCHYLSSMKKGFSARLNLKSEGEKPKKHFKLGKGEELPEQLELFNLYLALAEKFRQAPIVRSNEESASRLLI